MSVSPLKANPPLIVNADPILLFAVPFQRLQPIPRDRCERSKIGSCIEHIQLAKGGTFDSLEPAHRLPADQPLGFSAPEGPNHTRGLYCSACNVKQYTETRRIHRRLRQFPRPLAARFQRTNFSLAPLDTAVKCLLLLRGSAIGSTPAFGAGYLGSSPSPGAIPPSVAARSQALAQRPANA
jgi:hypothetical protein